MLSLKVGLCDMGQVGLAKDICDKATACYLGNKNAKYAYALVYLKALWVQDFWS